MSIRLLDIVQRDLMRDERVQPLTRATSRIHVVEEARHTRFARDEVARRTPRLGHHRTKPRDASSGLVAFLREVGLVGGSSELLRKRAGLAGGDSSA